MRCLCSRSRQQAWCLSALPSILGCFGYASHGRGVTPHCRQPGCANSSRCVHHFACASGRGVFRSSLPGPVTVSVGCCARSVGKSAGATTFAVAAVRLRLHTTTLPSLPLARKELLSCVVVGTSLSSCLSRSCSCGCLLSFFACFASCLPGRVPPFLPGLRLFFLSSPSSPLASPPFPLSFPPPSFSALPSSFGSRAASRRRPRSSCAFGLVSGSSVRSLLLCCAWAVGGLLPCLCCLFPRCLKLVSSTVTEHEACMSSIRELLDDVFLQPIGGCTALSSICLDVSSIALTCIFDAAIACLTISW